MIDLRKQPTGPGVYLMKDSQGSILYVGKAKNIRQRLRSYLQANRDSRPQIRFLMDRTTAIETIVTDTEKEALILENTLIKKHPPRYNIHLRDDKTFVSLRCDLNKEFPALEIVRQVRQDGARYFGPYASAAAVRETLKEVYRIFPLRHYPLDKCRSRGRPCLFYQIGQCSGPCHGLIGREEYQRLVQGVVALLSGRQHEVLEMLTERMKLASSQMRYEEAARIRDQIDSIEETTEYQKSVRYGGIDQDVIGLYREGGEVEIVLMFIRQGRLMGRRNYNLDWLRSEADLLEEFLAQYYDREVPLPDEILLPVAIEGAQALSQWLTERRGRKVKIVLPHRGERHKIVNLATRNAEESLAVRGSRKEARNQTLSEIMRVLQLRRLPRRMECFDISTIQGTATVGSMAVTLDGESAPKEYRHYRIKSVNGMDDYASLREVFLRRLSRGRADQLLPDFILVDGGKGQLKVLETLLKDLDLSGDIDIAGIAKSRVIRNAKGKRIDHSEERFFLPGRKNPVVFRKGSAGLFMLERLRDEAHRFAVKYHRLLRSKRQTSSALSQIEGVGIQRQKALLKYFGSLNQIRMASLQQLQQMPGLPRTVAERIYQHFHL